MLKLHGYCCLLAVFFRFCLPFFPFIFRVSVSTLQSRSCLTSFRCPAVSACLCVSRSFRTLFRVPYRGYVEFLFLCQKARMILCSAAVAVYVEATRLYTTAVYWRFFLFCLHLLFFNTCLGPEFCRNNRIRRTMSCRTRPKRNLGADSKSVFALTLLAPGDAMNVKSCIMRLFCRRNAHTEGSKTQTRNKCC